MDITEVVVFEPVSDHLQWATRGKIFVCLFVNSRIMNQEISSFLLLTVFYKHRHFI